ncbi:hypothetical protein [Alcanivorax sp.]|uniref:hypothetical protein n=1 Tax=Alcanivorax sp. TaxID=1872427 RepID=UPI003A9199A2
MKLHKGLSFYKRDSYLREQQRETQFAPRISCKGPHIRGPEDLCRIVYSPEDVKPDNSFRPEAISCQDLMQRGFSIQRVSYTTRAKIDALIHNYTSRKPGRAAEYLLLFKAETVRKIIDQEGHQAFIIVDSAKKSDDEGHALIYCADRLPKSKVKELRYMLAEKISNAASIEAVFPA